MTIDVSTKDLRIVDPRWTGWVEAERVAFEEAWKKNLLSATLEKNWRGKFRKLTLEYTSGRLPDVITLARDASEIIDALRAEGKLVEKQDPSPRRGTWMR